MSTLSLEVFLGALALVLLLVETFVTVPRKLIACAAIGGLLVALVALFFCAKDAVPPGLVEFYKVDSLALFYKGLALVSTIAVLVIALEYAPVINQFVAADPEKTKEAGLGEFFALPLIVCVGLMVMASAVDLITIFVSLELTTVSFYVLVAYMRRSASSLEAGVKYLILGALSTGLLVYGMAWLYGLTGQMTLAGISDKITHWQGSTAPLLFAVALILAGIGFKVAAVPFQIWVPDVYQGAPTPVTAFLSVGSKASGFIVLSRVVTMLLAKDSAIAPQTEQMLLIIAGATILFGNLAAIAQTNFKRLLGYSSISHAGYLLLALACTHTGALGFTPSEIVAFYLATYLPMTFICFLVLAAGRAQGINEDIAFFRGLARTSPVLGFSLTLALASLAGLPLTAGFMGKFFVFFSATLEGNYASLLIAIIGAAAGFYYYFKVILAIHSVPEEKLPAIRLSALSQTLLAILVAAIIVIGVYPDAVRNLLVK
ncbi:MAG: NADH-quinone oxidoreductase subunit N [Verrucomicrobia bacterium]|nr:NADH-quinone oxidoreductase subunit N [Verrucomicrobiota bacterium]